MCIEDEEAIKLEARRSPNESTQEERRMHEATHLPYRDWFGI